MADLVALRQALQRIGFTNEAATYITNEDEGGMNDLASFRILTDDEVDDLCKTVRRPGGLVANPNAADAGQPAQTANPGIPVSLKACANLKLMCYFLRFKRNTSRAVAAPDITQANLDRLRGYKQWEEDHDDPDPPEINFGANALWPRIMETMEAHLCRCLGVEGFPLAYIVRDTVAVPDEDDDPDNWSPDTVYGTIQEELIARSPHKDANDVAMQHYRDNNIAVYEIIANLCRDQDCWTYIKSACGRRRDGRAAFKALKDHYLGPNMVDNQANVAETKLATGTYTGEGRRWDFERYARRHVEQHAILASLEEHGYAGIDDLSKVRHLLNGIKDPKLDSVIATIRSSETLRRDFNACVNLFQTTIKQNPDNMVRKSNVSAVNVRGAGKPIGKAEWDNVEPDMNVELRYYKGKEYANLSAAKKKGLKIKRDKRKQEEGKQGGGGGLPFTSKKAMVKTVKRIVKNQLSNKTKREAEESDESDEETTTSGKNRTNPALKRRKS